MGIKFTASAGGAKKSSLEQFTYKNGDNCVRIFGDLLPRYIYWVKGENEKNIPMECLSFDRNSETFNNIEHDHVKDFYPDLKCGWSYAVQCIDYSDMSVKVLNLKRKLFDQIIVAMEDLGDKINEKQCYNYMMKADPQNEGKISYESFKNLVHDKRASE